MRRSALLAAAVTAASIMILPRVALAETVHVTLTSYEEVPALSTTAGGQFRAFINDAAGTITYQLSYSGLTGDVAMAHIHFGQMGVNAGISVWLCQTVAPFVDPTGLAPSCVQSGTVTGVLRAANVVGPANQGIPPTQFDEIVAAIRAGVAYVNVHSAAFLGGEIRGQL
jgi:hypothetical protein